MVYQKGSVLGPLLFNIFLSDLIYFVESTDIVNYAGDTLPYSATECVIENFDIYRLPSLNGTVAII